MKTLLFCNLIPLKTGAYETVLAAVGSEHKAAGNEYVVVFAGEPIAPVAESLRAAGVRWHVMREWVGGGGELLSCSVVELLSEGPAGSRSSTTQQPNNLTTVTGEKVHPWGFVLPAVRLIRLERPDVVAVHFGNELPTLVASLLCRLLGWCSRLSSILTTRQLSNSTPFRPPRWVWEQDQQIQDPGKVSRRLSKIRFLGLGIDRYLAVYEGGRDSMIKRGIPLRKISVIYNSIAAHSSRRQNGWLCEELALDRDAVLLVSTGSLIPRKRIDFILKACALLQKRGGAVGSEQLAVNSGQMTDDRRQKTEASEEKKISHLTSHASHLTSPVSHLTSHISPLPPWHLLIIGEGPERERLEALAAELGIIDCIHYLGLRSDVREILAEADLLVHASLAETCTYAITESMAAGIPAVVTEAGAAHEQIVSNITGYVLGRDDLSGFAAKLRDLMRNSADRKAMGKAARERWLERYKLEVAAKKFQELYASLMKQAGN